METDQIKALIAEVEKFSPSDREQLEKFRIKFLSRKGILAELFAALKSVDSTERKNFGLLINELKTKTEDKIQSLKDEFAEEKNSDTGNDLTLPGEPITLGSSHPVTIIRNRIVEIFGSIGYAVSEGPEIEDDWHNFSALNFPEDHPARDMQDTFFTTPPPKSGTENKAGEWALRTHTSSVQVRVMENQKPPIRTISPGRVYRNEAISARAHCFFHQVEGLYIDDGVSFADLKQTLLYFAREMFDAKTEIRLRPSYFPFTVPSGEMDISCFICSGKGCNVCKYSGWAEILGCGMVHPKVLENCGIDSNRYTGYAFGMGIERIAMLKFGIKDLRTFSENDVRFLEQFRGINS